jgi:hypothetical protein
MTNAEDVLTAAMLNKAVGNDDREA